MPTISERLLRRWRREALTWERDQDNKLGLPGAPRSELYKQIVLMTQELLDQHLLRKVGKRGSHEEI